MTGKVESMFLEPLEAHYETKAKVGVRLTILSELRDQTDDTLAQAVVWIKTNRKAMSFPSPLECIDACKRFASVRVSATTSNGKPLRYGEKVAAYAAARGKDAKYPVIKKWTDETKTKVTDEWRSWRDYWFSIGAKMVLDETYSRESWTVPTNMPEEFDAQYQKP
jgi:hypothetical protein